MTDPVKIIVGEGDITEVQVPEYGIIQTGGGGGGSGSDGATFFPEVSQEGVISWTNDGGYDNPEPVNIKGPAGNDGSDGEDGQNGVTFTPSVSDAGIISWTNDGDLPNPSPVNIKGASGNDGEDGDDGTTFTPAVDASGNLSWTNDGGKPNPDPVNIRGPKGEPGDASLTILSYGHSTWSDFIAAYNSRSIVYCRASSNSNPASGSQTRLAFMAYVNSTASPSSVEFQYYRSVSSHTDAQQGDQVFIYKLTSAGAWTVTVRDAFTKVVAGTNMTSSYANGTLTLNATGGGGGTSDYDNLSNRPSINNVTLSGNKTAADLGLGTYSKPSGGIPASDLASAVLSPYRTAAAQDTIDAAQDAEIDARAKANEIAVVITGARPSRAVTAGQYVIVRGSTISGITDGLYVVKTGYTLSPSTDVTASSLSAVNIGGLNFLLSQIEDSGWTNLTLTSAFTLYGTSSVAQYRKIGNLVMVRGQIKPTSEIAASGTNTVMSTLPTGFRPSLDYVFICQGSSANRWALTVYANGNLGVGRYGAAEFANIPTNAWLVFNVVFFVG